MAVSAAFAPGTHGCAFSCRSSVVEHLIGNEEVHSSILCGSTISSLSKSALVRFSVENRSRSLMLCSAAKVRPGRVLPAKFVQPCISVRVRDGTNYDATPATTENRFIQAATAPRSRARHGRRWRKWRTTRSNLRCTDCQQRINHRGFYRVVDYGPSLRDEQFTRSLRLILGSFRT